MSPRECPAAEAARRCPEAEALIWPGGSMSFAQLDGEAARIAARLAAQGIGQGDRVALWQETSPELVATLLALPRLGAIACPISLRAAPAQLPALLEAVAARGIVADRPLPPLTVPRLSTDGPARGFLSVTLPDAQPVTAVFTSGSSGVPKAVLHNAGNHRSSAQGANAALPLAPGDRWILSLPLFHVGGLSVLWRCLSGGAAIALPEQGAPLAASLGQLGITHLSVVPTQLRRLLDAKVPRGALRAVISGGDGTPRGLLAEAAAQGWPVHTTYGSTEAAAMVTLSPAATSGAVPRDSGRRLPNRRLRIAESGEIELAGPTLGVGYLRRGALMPLLGPDGWFQTGDLGHLGPDGGLHVTGRRDRMFISGGENLHPEAIEQALADLPGVVQAAVVAVPDKAYGHRPAAFLRHDWGDVPDLAATTRAALAEAGTLPRMAWPDRVLAMPDEASVGMKPDRRRLAALAEQENRAIQPQ
jgi:O-succinylbenzoic acid--CoA ligase